MKCCFKGINFSISETKVPKLLNVCTLSPSFFQPLFFSFYGKIGDKEKIHPGDPKYGYNDA